MFPVCSKRGIDADLADTVLPIEALIRRLAGDIGLSRRALAAALDPAAAKASPAAAGPKPWDEIPGHAAAPSPPPRRYDYTPGAYRTLPAADLGLPGGLTLTMPPALKERLEKRRREAAGGGSGNRGAPDRGP